MKIYNPFLEGEKEEQTEVVFIVDKSLGSSTKQKQVFSFFVYYIKADNDKRELFDKLMKEKLGQDKFNLITNTYINSFDEKTGKMTRYAYCDDKDQIRQLYEAVEIIHSILPELRMITQEI